MGNLRIFLKNNTSDINSICELGAGRFDNFSLFCCPIRIGIELIPDYIENKNVADGLVTKAILGDATKFEDLLDEDVDAFAIIDFLEHLDKDVAIDLIKRLQNKCRRIMVFIPHGTNIQDGTYSFGFCDSNVENKLRESNNVSMAIEAQRHKSKWYVKDFTSMGFHVDHDKTHHSRQTLASSKHIHGDDGGTVMWAIWNK